VSCRLSVPCSVSVKRELQYKSERRAPEEYCDQTGSLLIRPVSLTRKRSESSLALEFFGSTWAVRQRRRVFFSADKCGCQLCAWWGNTCNPTPCPKSVHARPTCRYSWPTIPTTRTRFWSASTALLHAVRSASPGPRTRCQI